MFLRTLWTLLRARRHSKLTMSDVGRLTMRVLPNDLDVQRHVNNGVYLSLMDLGRVDLLVRTGAWQRMRAHAIYPVIASETISFRKSLTLWQRYVLETRIVTTSVRCTSSSALSSAVRSTRGPTCAVAFSRRVVAW